MKKIHFILSFFLSLVLIYAGAGVAVIHYCCMQCEELGIEAIEANGCHDQHHHHQQERNPGCCQTDELVCMSHEECDDEHHCSATIDKLDLFFESEQMDITVAVTLISEYLVPGYFSEPIVEVRENEPYYVPPYPDTSRYYLNLYSVLLI